MAPMLVPTTMSTGIPASSITLRTPTWANPSAAPPESTTATTGRERTAAVPSAKMGATQRHRAADRSHFRSTGMAHRTMTARGMDRREGGTGLDRTGALRYFCCTPHLEFPYDLYNTLLAVWRSNVARNAGGSTNGASALTREE